MSAKRTRTLALSRLWGNPEEERQPLARTPDERTTAYFHQHSRNIIRMLQNVYGERDDIEDAVQRAFLCLHVALTMGKEIHEVRAWLFTVARNEVISVTRKTIYEEKIYRHQIGEIIARTIDLDAGMSPEALFLDRARGEKLRDAMSSLSDLERQCLFARAEGLTLAEIGRVVHMDLRRVSEIVREAVLKLQRNLNA